MIGTKLANYEITAHLGSGGMGDVYQATDAKLGRTVAIKILPEVFSHDAERVARFQREARMLASLNHPNIAAIHEVAEINSRHFLVMELVPGETLADRIRRSAIPIEEAIPIAKQIAEALEEAHEKGVIHRDLKPANIKVTPDGKVKVLDFGLAKAYERDQGNDALSNSPTMLSVAATNGGVILGTAAYMSPEQAMGKATDRRSDIFSFGAVLYETLSGENAFVGATTQETLVAVAKDDPDWSKLPADIPGWLRALLGRCLVKDRKRRLQAIAEARLIFENPPENVPTAAVNIPARRAWLAWAGWAAAALAVGAGAWGWSRPSPAVPLPVVHFTQALPPGLSDRVILSLSADGSKLALRANAAGQGPIYVRALDNPEAIPVPGTNDGIVPAFSPDGSSLAFRSDLRNGQRISTLQTTTMNGGAISNLVPSMQTAGNVPYVCWGEDGNILYVDLDKLARIPAGGGNPEVLATLDVKNGEFAYAAPQLLPGGKTVLVSVATKEDRSEWRAAALDLRSREMKTIMENTTFAWFVTSGGGSSYLVYNRGNTIFAAAFDPVRLRAGTPTPVLNGVRMYQPGAPGAQFGVSMNGTLAYVPGSTSQDGPVAELVWVDRLGKEQPTGSPQRAFVSTPEISPDGRNVALQVSRGGVGEILVYDLARGSTTRVTSGQNTEAPRWTADSKRILYVSAQPAPAAAFRAINLPERIGRLLSMSADGLGAPVELLGQGPLHVPLSVAQDGTVILGRGGGVDGHFFLMQLSDAVPSGAKLRPFLEAQNRVGQARFSPDRSWLAYTGDAGLEARSSEVFVAPYPGPGERVTVSVGGGSQPRWSANGRELFYRNGNKLMVVDVPPGSVFRPGKPRMMFEKAGSYDVAPDGRFLFLTPRAAPEQSAEIHIVVNWIEELRRRVPLLP